MRNNELYPFIAIATVALVTIAIRSAPFIIFGNRPLPKVIKYLERFLPPSIMTILVIYCLRNTDFASKPFGIAEMSASLLVVILQAVRKNMYISIIAGTICYMVLIRIL
ncbi:branched-chain amino acid transporter permease [Treponema sp. Marseille-Q3903]|uniref:branched-chain amino acid transporter permease n=1 Tax=Treponema sp. Marseille-Q3903 TaxID=2766703 RepID=UPI001652ADC8|nr:AzlD domain-containing protein [Treponema sp. Marseille-Q3903]MBC6712827.1 AzlD domain-containing protein [Treponema sp. Marseille-Q3903]